MSVPAGWEGILEEGEKILWQGRPDGRLRPGLRQLGGALFGLVFAGFALFWMLMAAAEGGSFWIYGLGHFALGMALAVGPIAYDVIRRRRTWYTLTDRRAFIATDMPLVGRRLAFYPIRPDSPVRLLQTRPPSVYFARKAIRTRNRSRHVPVGFEMIEDAHRVMALIHGIQKEAP